MNRAGLQTGSQPAGGENTACRTILPGSRSGAVRIPASKSVAHRALICAAIGGEPVTVQLNGLSRDILATAECLRAMGAGIEIEEGEIRVRPLQREAGPDTAVLPVGESGSTLRFLLPLAGALGMKADFVMEGRLSRRPLSPLDAVLRDHGMRIEQEGNILRCEGQLQSGTFILPGNISSQYFSGLLMALPLLKGNSILLAEGTLESASYIRITEQVLESAGIAPEQSAYPADGKSPNQESFCAWRITGGRKPQLPAAVRIEADWSNAAFFLCMGALSERGVTVQALRHDSAQGDRAILQLLRDFGAEVTDGAGAAEGSSEGDSGLVRVRRDVASPLRIDASEIPDLVPVLAVLCCAAAGKSEIVNAARLRLKESDRLQTTAELICSLGGNVKEREDGLVIYGTGSLRGGVATAHNDHRIAMSAAVAASLCRGPVILQDADCVRKSYPVFWKDFEAMTVEQGEIR